MRKVLAVLALFAIYCVFDFKFTGWDNLSALPSKVLPSAWSEAISDTLSEYSSDMNQEMAKALPPEPKIPLYKMNSDLTAKELEVKQRLEQQSAGEIAPDVITKTNGSRLEGEIVEETATQVRLEQEFRGAGKMSTWVPRASIRRVQHAKGFASEVTYRDIRYQMEFPNLSLYLRPPFSVLTEKNYFEVAHAVDLLDDLHSQFQHEFKGVMQESKRAKSIQLLFFSEEEDFEFYRDQYATHLGYSVGFYSPRKDRLVIYDQENSAEATKAIDKLEAIKANYQKQHRSSRHQQAARLWSDERKRELSVYVAEITRRILRHEGAHQLFSTYQVHSEHGAEHLWLIEGLAVYCESQSFGARPDHLLAGLQAGQLSFPKLVDFGDLRGFGEIGNEKAIEAAYAMSGLMVYVLMQPEYRAEFFEFIQLLQDPEWADRIEKVSQFELLSLTLGVEPEMLEQRFLAELRRSV